ncbi:MAG: hypothetical protein DI535_00890 [Citrobacter freundii]|nr:MAG: hypothetical protein DI535_00890 [Citrobacter freundii]
MIRFVAAAALLLSLASCMKGSSIDTPDNQPYVPIQRDTVRTGGQLWGINVGSTAEDVYETIQSIRADKQISYLGIVGNVYNDLSALQNKIPLYNSIFMDETTTSPTGIQVGFETGKIKVIYMNNGTPLAKWPSITEYANGLAIGDTVTTIYDKLVGIKSLSIYGNKLQKISLFDKNLSTDYDPAIANSAQWQIVTSTVNKRWQLLELNFSLGSLTSIYYTLNEYK